MYFVVPLLFSGCPKLFLPVFVGCCLQLVRICCRNTVCHTVKEFKQHGQGGYFFRTIRQCFTQTKYPCQVTIHYS